MDRAATRILRKLEARTMRDWFRAAKRTEHHFRAGSHGIREGPSLAGGGGGGGGAWIASFGIRSEFRVRPAIVIGRGGRGRPGEIDGGRGGWW